MSNVRDNQKLLQLGIDKRDDKIKKSWNELNIENGNYFKDGEGFRCWVKKQLKKEDRLPKREEKRIEEVDTKLKNVRNLVGELDIIKHKVSNEKRELRNIKRDFIKSIVVSDDIKEYLETNKFKVVIPEYCKKTINNESEYKMIINTSDWHIGYVIDDCKNNYYNYKIANKRVDKLIEQAIKYVKLYNINKIHIVDTGDVIEHSYMRKNQGQFTEFSQAEQICKAIELIYRFITALNKYCHVEFDTCYGNHDRINGDKDSNLDGDNAEVIIREMLTNYINISGNKRVDIIKRLHTDKEIIKQINGLKLKFMHGDNKTRDESKLLKQEMSIDNDFYDILFKGHLHNFGIVSENHGRYIISTGCLSGYNDYSLRFGCATVASQTIVILGNNEIELIKDVQLN